MTAAVALLLGADADLVGACAVRLATAGFAVVTSVVGQLPDSGSLAGSHGLEPLELSAEGGAARVADAERIGPLEVLVTLPGSPVATPILRGSAHDLDDEHQRLVSWQFGAARAAAHLMVPRRSGRLVFVTSTGALQGASFEAAYGASSASVIGLSRALARELGPRKVTANVVLAGPLASLAYASPAAGTPRHQRHLAEVADRTPRGRLCEPSDVAGAVAYLASPLAAFTTGAILPVDGGLSMGFG